MGDQTLYSASLVDETLYSASLGDDHTCRQPLAMIPDRHSSTAIPQSP